MSNLVTFPDPRKAREDASLWLAKLDRGLNDEERSGLREWLKDLVNHKAFLEMGKLWRGLDVISVLCELFPLSPEILNPKPRRSLPAVVLAAAAAAACVAAFSTLFLMGTPWSFLDGARISASVHSESYRTAVGETRTARLADGSNVMLNTSTRLVVVYAPRVRDVYLSYGEANFEVAHEPSRPFNVHAGKRTLQAVGTMFNVRVLSPDNVELTVTEGKVKVLRVPPRMSESPARLREEFLHGETTVSAFETALVEPGLQSVRRLDIGEIEARLAWQRSMLIFQGEPLEQVLAEIERYTDTKFILNDEKLRDVRVGGYFRAGDVAGFLAALRENFLIDSRRDAQGRVVLTVAPAP